MLELTPDMPVHSSRLADDNRGRLFKQLRGRAVLYHIRPRYAVIFAGVEVADRDLDSDFYTDRGQSQHFDLVLFPLLGSALAISIPDWHSYLEK